MIILIIIDIDKQGQNGTTIFNILDNPNELWMTKYIIGEIFTSGGATLYKNPSDQTVPGFVYFERKIIKHIIAIDMKFSGKLASSCVLCQRQSSGLLSVLA